MSKQKTTRAKTSRSLPVFIADTSSTTGGGLSGVTSASSGLVLEYRRQNQSTWTSVTAVSKTLGTYVSGGIVADGSLGGAYEVDFPDAAFASAAGVEWVALRIRGVANMLPVLIEIELDAVDYQDATAFGLSKFSDLETDTQNIQSRIPAALVDGRIVANAQVVGDKTGYTATVSDKTGFSLLAGTGLGNQNANITGNLSGSVGSINGVTFPANFQALSITVGGAIAELGTNALSANDLYTPIANAVAATQVLSRLDSMIESNGSGQFRFDTIAVSMVTGGGGGGGGTDWTADERTAIRTILGVPTSGTTPTDPSSGILDTIRDSVGAIGINVYPVSASTPERVAGTTITYYRNEIRSVSVVTDFTLTNLTLSLTIEDAEGTDLLTISNASISRSGQTFTVSIGTAVTASVGSKRWALRDITGGTNSVIARGVFSVQEAASA